MFRGILILTVNLYGEGQSLVFTGFTGDDTLDQLLIEFSGWDSNKRAKDSYCSIVVRNSIANSCELHW